MQMCAKIILKRGIGRAVVNTLAVEGNPGVRTGANEPIPPLVGFVGQRGACAQKGQAFAAVLQKLLRGEAAAAIVVTGNAGDAWTQAAVDGNGGNALRDAQIWIVGQANDAADDLLFGHEHIGLIKGEVTFCEEQQHLIIAAGQFPTQAVRQLGEKGIVQVRQYDLDDVALVAAQRPGLTVDLIAEPLDGLLYALLIALAHGNAVDDL